MIHILNKIKVNACISSINFTDSEIHILDANFLVNVYSKEDFSPIYKYLLTKEEDNKHTYDKTYSICGDINTYICNSNSSIGYLYTLKKNNLISKNTLSFHDNSVSFSTFSHNSKLVTNHP